MGGASWECRSLHGHGSLRGWQGGTDAGWFIRRVGLARSATCACVLGLALPALGVGRVHIALAGVAAGVFGAAASLWMMSRPKLSASGRRWRRLVVLFVLLIGFFSGQVWGVLRVENLAASALQSLVGKWVDAELVVVGEVRFSQGWQSALAVVRRIPGLERAAGEKVLVEIPPDTNARGGHDDYPLLLEEGLIVAGRARVLEPRTATDSGGFDQRKQLLSQGARYVLRVQEPSAIKMIGRRGGLWGSIDQLRRAAREHLSRGPEERVDEALKGVVLGDTSGMDRGWLESFRRAGTAHMFAVSGLHVGSLAALVLGAVRIAGAARWVGFLSVFAVALFMVFFAGGSPSVIRAAVMIGVAVLGRWLGRGGDRWQVLALAAAVVLGLNPFALFDVGFQLSFTALGGILLFSRPLERVLHRFPLAVRSNLAVSLAAGLGTAPVSLAVFGRTSLISPLANVLAVPVLSLVVGGGIASVFLGLIWDGLSTAIDHVVAVPLAWIIVVSRLCGYAPVLETGQLGQLLFSLAALTAAVPVSLALLGRQVPAPFRLSRPLFGRVSKWVRRHRPTRAGYAWFLAIGLLLTAFTFGTTVYPVAARGLHSLKYWAAGQDWPAAPEATVLDVGQGNALLLRTPTRHALLFDGGPAGCDLAGKLRALGVTELDLVVISHPHADHFAGLAEALDEVKVGSIVDHVQVVSDARSGTADETASAGTSEAYEYVELLRRLEQKGQCKHVLAETGTSLTAGGVVVDFYAPSRPLVLVQGSQPWALRGSVPSAEELNNASLVARISAGGWDLLLPGDAEAEVLEDYALPPVEVLVVPHHGSKDGVSLSVLERLRPTVAVVSVGKDNPFGHPAPETMRVLSGKVPTVLRTDQCGWVSCCLRDDSLLISAERTKVQ